MDKSKKAKKGSRKEKMSAGEALVLADEALDQMYDISFFDDEIPRMDMDETIAFINKRVNEGKKVKRAVLKRADQAGSPFKLRRPFGIASLDIAIGGGMPAGGITQIGAPSGVGKNALAATAVARCQYLYGEKARIALIWTEVQPDKEHMRINGAVIPSSEEDLYLENADRAKKGLPPLSEEGIYRRRRSVGEILVADEGNAEERLQAAVDLVIANNCKLIVIDSIAAAVSKYRVNTPLEDEPKQSAEASMLSSFQKLCWNAFCTPRHGKLNFTSMLVINQVRANRSTAKFKREWTVGGPYAIRHGKLVDITLKPGDRITTNGRRIGKVVGWEIAKGKAGCHEGPSGELPYYYATGFDRYTDLISTCVGMEVAIRSGRYYDIVDHNGEVIHSKISGGKEGLINMAYEDQDFFDQLYYACLAKAEVSCLHHL